MGDIFKVGDRVFCYNFGGWGTVIKEHESNYTPFRIRCSFPIGDASFTQDGRFYKDSPPILSFTEYTLEGFSQERPEELPKPGDIVWVKDKEYDNWRITYFRKQGSVENFKYGTNPKNSGDSHEIIYYKYLTTKNPYANEQ